MMSRFIVAPLLLWALACGAADTSTTTPSCGPEDRAETVRHGTTVVAPTEGGPLVRMGRLHLPAGEALRVEPTPREEVFLFIEEGRLGSHSEGTALCIRGGLELAADADVTLIAAVVRSEEGPVPGPPPSGIDSQAPEVSAATIADTPLLPFAGGQLGVRIFHDAASGAHNAAFSHLDAAAGLSVPEHVHEDSAEVLFIVEGNGTMILGDERFVLVPGQVIYIPANTNHGYEAGTGPMRAFQVYAPPGPEQRFRTPSPAPTEADSSTN